MFSSLQKTTKEFNLIAAKHNTPVFIMDPDILNNLVQYNAATPGGTNNTIRRCKFLCHSSSIRTFGVLDVRWITKVLACGQTYPILSHCTPCASFYVVVLGHLVTLMWGEFKGRLTGLPHLQKT